MDAPGAVRTEPASGKYAVAGRALENAPEQQGYLADPFANVSGQPLLASYVMATAGAGLCEEADPRTRGSQHYRHKRWTTVCGNGRDLRRRSLRLPGTISA